MAGVGAPVKIATLSTRGWPRRPLERDVSRSQSLIDAEEYTSWGRLLLRRRYCAANGGCGYLDLILALRSRPAAYRVRIIGPEFGAQERDGSGAGRFASSFRRCRCLLCFPLLQFLELQPGLDLLQFELQRLLILLLFSVLLFGTILQRALAGQGRHSRPLAGRRRGRRGLLSHQSQASSAARGAEERFVRRSRRPLRLFGSSGA